MKAGLLRTKSETMALLHVARLTVRLYLASRVSTLQE